MLIYMPNIVTIHGFHPTNIKQFIIDRYIHYRKNITSLFGNVFNGSAYYRFRISLGVSKFPAHIINIILTLSDL